MSTKTRNTEMLAKNNHKLLKQDQYRANFYYLALDESCDTTQIIIHVRTLTKPMENSIKNY